MYRYCFVILMLIISVNLELYAQTLKVGGTYLIKDIEHSPQGFFIITFESVAKTGKFDILKLHTKHVHFSLQKGETVQISCELENSSIEDNSYKIAQISQAVIFLKSSQGRTPIWVTSINKPILNFDEANYLKIHAPQSDYLLF